MNIMLFKDYIHELYKNGDLSLIYESDLFSYSELKDIYINANEDLKKELLNVVSNRGNNLFKASALFEDFKFFKELFNTHKNTPLTIKNKPLIAYFEGVENHQEVELFFIQKLNNNELNLTPICYADAYFIRLLEKHNLNNEETYPFKNLYINIVEKIKEKWINFSNIEKIEFLSYLEENIKPYKHCSALDDDINEILNLEKNKINLVEFLLQDNFFIEESYFFGKPYILENNIKIEDINHEMLSLFQQIEHVKFDCIANESLNLAIKINKFDISIDDINLANSIKFKKLLAFKYLLIDISKSKTYSENKFIRTLVQNYDTEISDDKINSEYYIQQIKDSGHHNILINKRHIYERLSNHKGFSNYLVNNIDKIHPIYKNLMNIVPTFIEEKIFYPYFYTNDHGGTDGRVMGLNNFPVGVIVKEPRKEVLIHEFTHVLQDLNFKIFNKPLIKYEKWRKIKYILTETKVSESDLIEGLTDLFCIDELKKESFKATLKENLSAYISNSNYKYDEFIKNEFEKIYVGIMGHVFTAYREHIVNGKSFMPTLWECLENKKTYWSKDSEIHARISELVYCMDVKDVFTKIITIGIKPGIIKKLKPLVEELNTQMWCEIKDYLAVKNQEQPNFKRNFKM